MSTPKLSEGLFEQAVSEMAASMKDRDLDLKKKSRKTHARDVLEDRLRTMHQMFEQFERMIANATIQTYDQPLRDGKRKELRLILTAYPGTSNETAKSVITELFGS